MPLGTIVGWTEVQRSARVSLGFGNPECPQEDSWFQVSKLTQIQAQICSIFPSTVSHLDFFSFKLGLRLLLL